jgi:phage terminase small subunit
MKTDKKILPFTGSKPPKKPPKPPRTLKKAGKKLWLAVYESFVLEEHDVVLLSALAETLDRKNLAEDELREAGKLTFENRYGEKRPHPACAIVRDCAATMAKLRRELNLSEIPPDNRPPKLKFGG